MRKLALLALAGLALAWTPPALGKSFVQLVQEWETKHRLVLYEQRLHTIGPYRKIRIRFGTLDKKADLAKLVKECVALYSRLYQGVWCYAYDNLRALDTDLRGPEYGGTLGACWIYRAARIPTGGFQFEKNTPLILQVNKCPRP